MSIISSNWFKKIIITISALLMFLAPIGIGFSHTETLQIVPNIEIHSAEALITYECGYSEAVGCSIGKVILNYYSIILFHIPQIILVIVGLMFDIILSFSLDSNFYRGGLMESGWAILRDFTNIIFIFALLVMSFRLVLGQDGGNTKKNLIKTILVALTINFSLFVSYFIIDASNLMAQVFYNNIEVQGNYNTSDKDANGATDSNLNFISESIAETVGDRKSVSLAIASKMLFID